MYLLLLLLGTVDLSVIELERILTEERLDLLLIDARVGGEAFRAGSAYDLSYL